MLNKTRKKLITSLAIVAMVVPMYSMTANAAASAPISVNHMADTTYSQFGNWDFGAGGANLEFDKNGYVIDKAVDGHTGKTDVTSGDPSNPIDGDVREAKQKERVKYLVSKATSQADNPAMPFIKVSTKDFLCIYGPMYGDLGTKYESCYFDSARYAADYPDVVAAVGNTHTALWNHYKTSGIYEGRRGYTVLLGGATTNPSNIYWDLADVWTPQMTDRELVVWVNKWLCDNMTYNSHGQIPGRECCGVCGPHAGVFNEVMLNLGIPCINISSAAVNHAWNQVFVDGQWLTVDVTWNDGDQDGGIERPDNTNNLLTNGHSKYHYDPIGGVDIIFKSENLFDVSAYTLKVW